MIGKDFAVSGHSLLNIFTHNEDFYNRAPKKNWIK